MATNTLQKRLETDPDFIVLRKYQFSLSSLLERYPDGCPDHVAAAALGLSEVDYQARYAAIVDALRSSMKVATEA